MDNVSRPISATTVLGKRRAASSTSHARAVHVSGSLAGAGVAAQKQPFAVFDITKNGDAKSSVRVDLPDSVLDVLRLVKLKPHNPSAMIRLSSDEEVHACLGLDHSPIPQGVDAAASVAALKAWIVVQFNSVRMNCEVQPGSTIFHKLDWVEYSGFQQILLDTHYAWATACGRANLSAGSLFAIMSKSRDKCTLVRQPFGPFTITKTSEL